jgi:hypothetical protein
MLVIIFARHIQRLLLSSSQSLCLGLGQLNKFNSSRVCGALGFRFKVYDVFIEFALGSVFGIIIVAGLSWWVVQGRRIDI